VVHETVCSSFALYDKKKTILVTGHGGPRGCEMLRLPHFLYNWLTDGSEVVNLTCRPPLPPGGFLVIISVSGSHLNTVM
jgi:hypothetical protein